jgi:succinate dehydrogenase / fumarate reductase membrane anchor subunit
VATVVRSSTVNVWQYITAIALIFVLTFHLMERVPGLSPLSGETYEDTLKSENVAQAYNSYSIVLGILLVAALFHGFNGLRGILLEMRQGRGWSLFVNVLTWILFVGFAVWGLRTIVLHVG